jgi:zinc protease
MNRTERPMSKQADRKNTGSLASTALTLACCLVMSFPVNLLAQYPTTPPPPGELRPLQFPEFQEATLDNGIQLVVVENNRLPIVSISFSLQAGSRYDPAGLEGLAGMVAELLSRGTTTRSADQIAEEIESVGANLSANASSDFITVSTTVISEHADLAFELIADVLINSTYTEMELELARTRILSSLRLEASDPNALATQFFASSVYGDHPYGRSQTEASVAAIMRSAVQQFAGMRLAPGGSLVVVSGDLSLADARRLLERYTGSWNGTPPTVETAAPPAPAPTKIVLVHRPGSAQSNIRVGNLAIKPGDDLFYPATVANRILGGGSAARLYEILRQQNGWTYGAYSGIQRRKDVGYFQANTEVRAEVTDSALAEILVQLRRMRTETVADSELTDAKGFLVGSFPLTIETPQQVAGQVARSRLLGLGDDYLHTYRERLAAVDATSAMDAARAVIHPDSAVVVVVGDGQAIYDGLAAIAPVTIVSIDGSYLTPADLTPTAVAIEFDRAQLVARRDSFQISFQGNPIGQQINELVIGSDVITYTETTDIPLMGMTQEATILLDPESLVPRSTEQVGLVAGQNIESHLTYEAGRVTGQVQVPQPTGEIETKQVDAQFVDGAVDASVIQMLLPSMPLAEGASLTVSAFTAAEGTVKPITVKVLGVEEVTVPAGTFSTYKVDVSGGEQPLILYVSTDTPRRVVRIELLAQPVVFELAGG